MSSTYNLACKLPPSILGVFGLLSNVAMVYYIHRRKTKHPYYFLLTCIGITNAALSIIKPVMSSVKVLNKSKLQGVNASPLQNIQFVLHLILAYDRWLAVSKPLHYRHPDSLKEVKRCTI